MGHISGVGIFEGWAFAFTPYELFCRDALAILLGRPSQIS